MPFIIQFQKLVLIPEENKKKKKMSKNTKARTETCNYRVCSLFKRDRKLNK